MDLIDLIRLLARDQSALPAHLVLHFRRMQPITRQQFIKNILKIYQNILKKFDNEAHFRIASLK